MKTYLFDFDGTLVDSMPSYVAAMLRILDENHISYGRDIIKIITPLGYAGTAAYYTEKLGLTMPVEKTVEMMKKYNVKRCYYGHLHGASITDAVEGNIEGIELTENTYLEMDFHFPGFLDEEYANKFEKEFKRGKTRACTSLFLLFALGF